MNEQDSVSEIDNPSSFLLSEEERNAFVLGCMSEKESLEDRNRWQGQSVSGNLKNIVSYEDMILKSKNPPVGERTVEKAGINDNVGDREAVFAKAGRRLRFENRWFSKKNLRFQHLTLMERRIARNLREWAVARRR